MRRQLLVGLMAGLALGACTKPTPSPQLMTPGSRLIYHDGVHGLFSLCDRGSRVYLTHSGIVQVIPGACPTGEP